MIVEEGVPADYFMYSPEGCIVSGPETGYHQEGLDERCRAIDVVNTKNKPVKPIFECWSDNGDGTVTVNFGYLNQNSFVVNIPHGDNNKMTPSTYTTNLPVDFQPGRTPYWPDPAISFVVPVEELPVVWTLEGPDGSRRTATAGPESPRCTYHYKPNKIWLNADMPLLEDLQDFKIWLKLCEGEGEGYASYNECGDLVWHGDGCGLAVPVGEEFKVVEEGLPKDWHLAGPEGCIVSSAETGYHQEGEFGNCRIIDIENEYTYTEVDDFKVACLFYVETNGTEDWQEEEGIVEDVLISIYLPYRDAHRKKLSEADVHYMMPETFGKAYPFNALMRGPNPMPGTYEVKMTAPDGFVFVDTQGKEQSFMIEILENQHFIVYDYHFALQAEGGAVIPTTPADPEPDPEPTELGQHSDNSLVLVDASEDFGVKGRGWENAIDNDVQGWDGTAWARGNGDIYGPAWAIFGFADEQLYQFNYIALQTDNGTDDDKYGGEYQTLLFEVQVSTSGTAASDFKTVYKLVRKGDGRMLWYPLGSMVTARYIKFISHSPFWHGGAWRQIVEFTVGTNNVRGAIPASQDVATKAVPSAYDLEQNYPNPFNPETTIRYQIPEATTVHLAVYDLNGRIIEMLVNEHKQAGSYSVTWSGKAYPSGLYFYRLQTRDFSQTRRMILIK